ncbi:MAG: GTP-binding protein [Oscillospiraceae bacterium]
MSKLCLITGFLGAGKTTFLKNLINQTKSNKLYVIVNEFGSVGIDGKILKELSVTVDEISNGSIFCSCKIDKFEDVLLKAIASEPDLILIETSGLSDPTNIKKILLSRAEFKKIEYLGGICLVDAVYFSKVRTTARVVSKQVSATDLALINKSDLASSEDISAIKKSILEINPDMKIITTSFGKISNDFLSELHTAAAGGICGSARDIALQSYTVKINPHMKLAEFKSFIAMFIEDSYRIKGFIRLYEGCFLVNCTGGIVEITEAENTDDENCLVALAGQNMPLQKSILRGCEWFHNLAELGES